MLAAGLTIGLALAPPITLPSADGARTALLVPVTDALSLTIVEASYHEQEALVDAALACVVENQPTLNQPSTKPKESVESVESVVTVVTVVSCSVKNG